MAKANIDVNYSAYNIARAAAGKNPFTFRRGLSDLTPGAYATAAQWRDLGYKIRKGCTASRVYSVDAESGKASCYCVFSAAQVRRTQAATIKAAELEQLAAETAGKGLVKAQTAARKYGELDQAAAAAAYKAVVELYAEQAPEREQARKNRLQAAELDRVARAINEAAGNAYEALYNTRNGEQIGITREQYSGMIDAGCELVQSEPEIYRACCQARQDCYVSDRECAAYALAFRAIVGQDEKPLAELLRRYTADTMVDPDAAQGGELLPIK